MKDLSILYSTLGRDDSFLNERFVENLQFERKSDIRLSDLECDDKKSNAGVQ